MGAGPQAAPGRCRPGLPSDSRCSRSRDRRQATIRAWEIGEGPGGSSARATPATSPATAPGIRSVARSTLREPRFLPTPIRSSASKERSSRVPTGGRCVQVRVLHPHAGSRRIPVPRHGRGPSFPDRHPDLRPSIHRTASRRDGWLDDSSDGGDAPAHGCDRGGHGCTLPRSGAEGRRWSVPRRWRTRPGPRGGSRRGFSTNVGP